MTRKAFESISEDHQKTVKEVFRKKLLPLNAQTRKDNEEALKVMADEGIRYVEVSPQELARFQKVADEAMEEIAGKVFSKAIFEMVNKHLAEFRNGKATSAT